MTTLTPKDIVGTWRVVRSEIPPPYRPDHEFFHFTSDGFHYWEYPFLDQSKKVFKFHYWINETGLCLTDCNGENPRDLMMTIDNDLLKMTGPHKYASWLKRINQADRPLYLSHYYEPISGT